MVVEPNANMEGVGGWGSVDRGQGPNVRPDHDSDVYSYSYIYVLYIYIYIYIYLFMYLYFNVLLMGRIPSALDV
jgi:hypothetical protein